MLAVDDIDLSDLEFWARPLDERDAAFAVLRAERPLPWFEEPEVPNPIIPRGPGYWAVTRHADVLEASRQPELFCSGKGAVSIPDFPPEMNEFYGSMISMDDPRHARLRRIVSAGFTPRMLKRVEDSVQRLASDIVDKVIRAGECDFVTDIAAPLPLRIICEMMGVPESHYDRVFHLSNIVLSMGDPEYVPEGEDLVVAFLEAGAELAALVQDLGAHRLEHPTDDLTSALVHASVDGEQLDQSELGSFFILLVVAGNETTRNALSHGLDLLTRHPDQRRAWIADPDAVTPTAVEEIVRWASPVIFMRRTLTRPATLSGHEFTTDDKVILFYNSANRDEDVFTDPDRFDVRRDPNPHVGFGAAGPHFCLGAHLARREISIMFRELLTRVPSISATGPPDQLRSNFINGIKHLPFEVGPVVT